MNSYELSRFFWDFAFENPSKIKPIHCAIYFFSIEHCNRLGWKKEFGLPTSMVIEAIGIKSYSVYKNAFDDLVEYNFFDVRQYSKNQYSSNIIALKDNTKANTKASAKALDKAMQMHVQKQRKSIVSINKHINNKPINNIPPNPQKGEGDFIPENNFLIYEKKEKEKKVPAKKEKFIVPSMQEVQNYCNERKNGISAFTFINFYQSKDWMIGKNKMKDWRAAIRTWEQNNNNDGNQRRKINSGTNHTSEKL